MATQTRRAEHEIRPLTVDEVIRMAEVGIIGETERVELVDGSLVLMSPEGVDHATATRVLVTMLARTYPDGFQVGSQSTVPLDEHTLLEPDVYVTRRVPWGRFPGAEDVVLVVEVARTSVRRDRGEKARLYSEWGAQVYWIVDLARREVVVHTGPGSEGYASVTPVRDGQLELPAIDGTVRTAELLPPA